MAIRTVPEDFARDLPEEFSEEQVEAKSPQLLDPDTIADVAKKEALMSLSTEELRAYADLEGIDVSDIDLDTSDPYKDKSISDLRAELVEVERQVREKRLAPKIEDTGVNLNFLKGTLDKELQTQVSGTPGFVQSIEQVFRPFREQSLLANIMHNSKRSAEKDEEDFQGFLDADPRVLSIDKAISDIENIVEAEDRDFTDKEWNTLVVLQEKRSEIESEAREQFSDSGTITEDESLTLSEMVNVVYEQPTTFFKGMLNEIAKDPYLLAVPAGYFKGALAGANVAKRVSSNAKIIKGAEIIGGSSSVAGLAASLEVPIDAAQQIREKGVVDTSQTIDNALISGVTAGVLTGSFKGIQEAVSAVRERSDLKSAFELQDDPEIIDAIIDETYKNNIYIDSNNNIILERATSEKVDTSSVTNQEELNLYSRAKEDLEFERGQLLSEKLTPTQRKEVGARALELKSRIPNLWQKVLDSDDKIPELLARKRTLGQRDSAVRSQKGNLEVAQREYQEAVVELRQLEETLLQDRDVGLEILRLESERQGPISNDEIKQRVERIKEEVSPEDLTWLERRRALRNKSDDVRRPKVMKLFDPINDERSFSEIGIDPEPPSTPRPETHNPLSRNTDSVWDSLVDISFGQSATRVKKLANASKTARKLYNIFRHDKVSVLKEDTHVQRVLKGTGKFAQKLEESMDNIRKPFGNSVRNVESANVLRAMRGEDIQLSDIESKTVEGLRELLDDFRKYAEDAGMELGEIENYMPRVYDTSVLRRPEKEAEFKGLLLSKGLDTERVNDIYQKIVERDGILEFNPQTLSTKRIEATSRPFGSRSLNMVTDTELEPFLVNNPYILLSDYINSGVRSVEFARSFGTNGEKLHSMIDNIVDEARAAGSPVKEYEIKRIIDLANALQGSYNRFDKRSSEAFFSGGVVAQQIMSLPLATVTSLTEPFIALARVRADNWVKGFGSAVKSASNRSVRRFFHGLDKDEVTKEVEQLGIISTHATNEHLNNLFGGEATTKTASTISSAFFKLIFLTQFTEFSRTWAQQASKADMISSLKAMNSSSYGPRIEAIRTSLEETGIDVDQGRLWVDAGADINDPFYQSLKDASAREANEMIVHPDATNRPMYMSSQKWSWVNMLMSYPTTFSNTVLHNWMTRFTKGNAYYKTVHGMKVLGTIATMMMVSDMTLNLKEYLSYGEDGSPYLVNETEGERVFRAANQAGLLGPAYLLYDATSSVKYGSDVLSTRLGPLYGTAEGLLSGTAELYNEGSGDSLKKTVSRMIPFINKNAEMKDFVYRNILGGGQSTRPLEPSEIQFDLTPPARRDTPSVFDDIDPRLLGVPEEETPEALEERRAIPDIFSSAEAAEATGTGPGIDFDFILSKEGGVRTEGYIPKSNGKVLGQSGVTVGGGVDIGQLSKKGIESLEVDDSIKDKISPYAGVKKEKADKLLKDNPLRLSNEEAEELTVAVHNNIIDNFKTRFNKESEVDFDNLLPEQQTVLSSVAIQYGPNWKLDGKPKNFWKQTTSGDWEAALKNLRDFGDDYQTRRNSEADLLEQGLKGSEGLYKETSQSAGRITQDEAVRRSPFITEASLIPRRDPSVQGGANQSTVNDMTEEEADVIIQEILEDIERRMRIPVAPLREDLDPPTEKEREDEFTSDDLENLFSFDNTTKEVLDIKKAFPDATLSEIREFYRERLEQQVS